MLAWQSLTQIAYGHTLSYKEQAMLIGRPQAQRAIGQANRRNPVPIILPCHRVVGSNGSLTGFSAGFKAESLFIKARAIIYS